MLLPPGPSTSPPDTVTVALSTVTSPHPTPPPVPVLPLGSSPSPKSIPYASASPPDQPRSPNSGHSAHRQEKRQSSKEHSVLAAQSGRKKARVENETPSSQYNSSAPQPPMSALFQASSGKTAGQLSALLAAEANRVDSASIDKSDHSSDSHGSELVGSIITIGQPSNDVAASRPKHAPTSILPTCSQAAAEACARGVLSLAKSDNLKISVPDGSGDKCSVDYSTKEGVAQRNGSHHLQFNASQPPLQVSLFPEPHPSPSPQPSHPPTLQTVSDQSTTQQVKEQAPLTPITPASSATLRLQPPTSHP